MRTLLLIICITLTVGGISYADDLKDVGPAPEYKTLSCEGVYDHLIEMDGMLYFMGNMKKQMDLLLKQEGLKKNKMLQEYVKQKPMIDKQIKSWQRQLNYWGFMWEKDCKKKTPPSQ